VPWVLAALAVVVGTVWLVAFGRTKADRAAREDPARRAYEGGCYSNTCGRGRAPGLMNHRMGRN
jgi:hypothetical protein